MLYRADESDGASLVSFLSKRLECTVTVAATWRRFIDGIDGVVDTILDGSESLRLTVLRALVQEDGVGELDFADHSLCQDRTSEFLSATGGVLFMTAARDAFTNDLKAAKIGFTVHEGVGATMFNVWNSWVLFVAPDTVFVSSVPLRPDDLGSAPFSFQGLALAPRSAKERE